MKKTAMQELIESLANEVDNLFSKVTMVENDIERNRIVCEIDGLNLAIDKAKSALSKERQQIEDAYMAGGHEYLSFTPVNLRTDAKEYFTHKYDDNESE